MLLKFDIEQVEDLMRSFHLMSGIRFVLFDADFQEIISYPKTDCDFCRIIKSHPETNRQCLLADRRAFEKCQKENNLVLYRCHAGLIEAAIPLHENEKVIGYLMFGQITDDPNKEHLYEEAEGWCKNYQFDQKQLLSGIDLITCKSSEEIHAAAKIMDACTSYIHYKELITPENNRMIESAKSYIEEHLKEADDIIALCRYLRIGRTKLYELFKTEMQTGISAYIRSRRMHRAKTLLKTTDLSVSEIAEEVGFSDYNYFSRVYKKTYGKSPRYYR